MTTTTTETDHSQWWVDSGSTIHITHDLNDLTDPQPYQQAVHTGARTTYSTHKGAATVNGIKIDTCLCVHRYGGVQWDGAWFLVW